VQRCGDARSEAGQQGQVGTRQEFIGRGQRIVRAAFERNRRAALGGHQRRQDGLQDQRRAARRADPERVLAAADRTGAEDQLLRAEFRTLDLRRTDLHGRLDGGQMLAHQARLGPPGPHPIERHALARDRSQRQRRPHDLAATFALGPVDANHVRLTTR